MKKLVALTSSLFAFAAACGDDGMPNNPDAGPGIDAAEHIDAPIDAPVTFTPPQAHSFQLSAAGHDRVMAAAAGPNGSFYVVGWRQADTQAATPKHIIVGKLLATGMPDTTFGTQGFLNTNVVFTGADDELDIATNMDGTIIVSATVAAATVNPLDANDNDIALIKITAAGALDTTWGGGDGIVVHSFNESIAVTTTSGTPPVTTTTYPGRDGVRGLDIRQNTDGHIFIHGYQRATGTYGAALPRPDTDFLVARFTNAGALDTTYGNGTGKFLLNIVNPTITDPAQNPNSSATPRGLIVLDQGAVLAGGYANAGLSTGPQAVLYRLTPAGVLDTNFNASGDLPGVHHEVVLGIQTEVYNFAKHGMGASAEVVTGGYGRNTGTINDWISLRFNATTGVRSTTWGGTTDGKVLFDPTPANNEAGSNCRNAIALPNGKTLLLGSSSRAVNSMNMNPEVQDAVFAVLDATGKLDTAYGTGIATYMLGDDGADAFWGGVTNSTNTAALIVGWRGTKGTASATNNDDAYAVLLPIR